MAGTIFLSLDRRWPAASWAFHWVAEFLADNVDDPEAADYLRRVIDSNMGILGLEEEGDFNPVARLQMLELLRDKLIPDAEKRLSPDDPERDGALEILQQLATMAREASP